VLSDGLNQQYFTLKISWALCRNIYEKFKF